MSEAKIYFNHDSDSSFDYIDARESDYLYIGESQLPGAGKGLFTAIPIRKDEIICLFKGEILTAKEALRREKIGEYKYFINMPDGSTMDSKQVKCFAKYANDATGFAKSKFKLNAIITMNDHHNICLVATCSIPSGNEIFCSYGKKYWLKYKADLK